MSAEAFLAGSARSEVSVEGFRDAFFRYGGEVKEYFETLKARVSPDLILTHHGSDLHQDHRLVAELTWNTFRDHLILEYEIPKYDGDLGSPNVFVHLDEDTARRKAALLLDWFPSQRSKPWFTEDLFLALDAAPRDGVGIAQRLRRGVLRPEGPSRPFVIAPRGYPGRTPQPRRSAHGRAHSDRDEDRRGDRPRAGGPGRDREGVEARRGRRAEADARTMHREAAETEERTTKVAEHLDGKKTAILEKARETKQEATEMMSTYLGSDADGLDGLEFMTMAEAGEVGHWQILGNDEREGAQPGAPAGHRLGDAHPGAPLPGDAAGLPQARRRGRPERARLGLSRSDDEARLSREGRALEVAEALDVAEADLREQPDELRRRVDAEAERDAAALADREVGVVGLDLAAQTSRTAAPRAARRRPGAAPSCAPGRSPSAGRGAGSRSRAARRAEGRGGTR